MGNQRYVSMTRNWHSITIPASVAGLCLTAVFEQLAVTGSMDPSMPSLAVFAAVGVLFGLVLGEALRRLDRVKRTSRTDPLTSLLNRGAFAAEVDRELERSTRYGAPFGLLVVDVDSFKRVNDHHGHNTGDAVLKAVADTIRQVTRGSDTLGRWGGDEFVILVPATGPAGCRALAERLRGLVARRRFPAKLNITLSVGIAQFTPGDDLHSLFQRADDAMYRAKRSGPGRFASDETQGLESRPKLRLL